MACRGEFHEDVVVTGEREGTDRQGNPWKTISYRCNACGKTWTETSGPGA